MAQIPVAWTASNSLDWDLGENDITAFSSSASSALASARVAPGFDDGGEDVAPSAQGDVAIKVSEAPGAVPLGFNSTSSLVAQIISSAPDTLDSTLLGGVGIGVQAQKDHEDMLKEHARVPRTLWEKTPVHQFFLEFIGAFVLTWVAVVVGLNPDRMHLVGFAAAVLAYLCGHISGGHFNPSLTLAMFLRGKMNKEMAAGYVICQFVGCVVGGLMTWGWFVKSGIAASMSVPLNYLEPHPHFIDWDCAFIEFVYTSVLCYLFMTLTSTRANQDNDHYEFMFGLYYSASVAVACNITRAYLNPAVSVGLAVSAALGEGVGGGRAAWFLIIADFLAAATAATWFRVVNRKDTDHKLLPPIGRNQNIHMQGTA